jgi:DNA-binding transcriptional regulator YiaG
VYPEDTVRNVDSEEVKRIRRRLGLTQTELAEALGVRRGAVARWENGARRVTEPIARLLVRLLEESKAKKRKQ